MGLNKGMIHVCPFCGHELPRVLKDGLSHCSHCNQVFDSSQYNQFLAASWQARKEHLSLEHLKHQLGMDEDEAILVHTYVVEYGYSHDEFVRLLKKLGVAHKSYIDYCA